MRNFYKSEARKESNSLGVGIKKVFVDLSIWANFVSGEFRKDLVQEGWMCLTLVTLTSAPSRKRCGKLHHKRASFVTLYLLILKNDLFLSCLWESQDNHHHSLWRVMFLVHGSHHLGVGWSVQTSVLKLTSGAYGQIMRKKTKDCFLFFVFGHMYFSEHREKEYQMVCRA